MIEERKTVANSDSVGRPKRDPSAYDDNTRKYYTGRAIRPTGRRLLDPRPSHE